MRSPTDRPAEPSRSRADGDGRLASGAPGPGRDAGSGAVLVLAVVTVALSLVLAAGLVGSAHVTAATAAAAADLAALAAAQHAADGGTDPCAQATVAARRNGALLTSCTPGPTGDVTVRVRVTSGIGDARDIARAGRPPARPLP
ncbi:flp pilus-assembly TadE/G-like family protein [Cellulomonas sp. Sa3CUA2]|uniref:Flp pilus-assembly TadE/G-like family protein n=1 Tax=Cellulomonas avistercoris TaxID=2762242 RepID=A0ABR8QH43_9CELL|nr:Rv3654c family TadE-like protein [Cellulomonas avistercoris]MBD7919720.1 flp pilus-assembly TadE/G-like family protein [Cellulomonas avistercoris]